eukprot:1390233-Amphidinium_carterae.1
MTFNVQTLRQSGRMRWLEEAVNSHFVDVLAVQEGRVGEDAIFDSKVYSHPSAGAVAGNYGCQLWFHQSIQHKVRRDAVHNPRLCSAVLAMHGGIFVLSAHIPHQARPREERVAYLEELSRVLLAHRRENIKHVVLMVDANAQLKCESLVAGYNLWTRTCETSEADLLFHDVLLTE